MERQEGYYWVKFNGKFEVAFWNKHRWFITGEEEAMTDNYFEYINENRIKAHLVMCCNLLR